MISRKPKYNHKAWSFKEREYEVLSLLAGEKYEVIAEKIGRSLFIVANDHRAIQLIFKRDDSRVSAQFKEQVKAVLLNFVAKILKD